MKKYVALLSLLGLVLNFTQLGIISVSAAQTTKKVGVQVTYPISDVGLGVDAKSLVHEPQTGINFRFILKNSGGNNLCIEEKALPVINGFVSYLLGSQYAINANGVSHGCNMDSLLSTSTYSVQVLGDLNMDGDFNDAIDFTSELASWTSAPSPQFDDSFLDSKTLDIQQNIANGSNGNNEGTNVNIDYNLTASAVNNQLVGNGNLTRFFDLDGDGITEIFSKGDGNGHIYAHSPISTGYESVHSSSFITLNDSTNVFVTGRLGNFLLRGNLGANSNIEQTNFSANTIAMGGGAVIESGITVKKFRAFTNLTINFTGEDITFVYNPLLRHFEEEVNLGDGGTTQIYTGTNDSTWVGTPFDEDDVAYYGGDVREAEINGTVFEDVDGQALGDFNRDGKLDSITWKNLTGGKASFTVHLQLPNGSYKDIIKNIEGHSVSAGTSILEDGIKPRYIRVSSHGSDANCGSHIVELQTIQQGTGINLALGLSTIIVETGGPSINNGRITDGNLSSSQYSDLQCGNKTLELDLGANYSLESVNVLRYFADNRTYFKRKTQVSENGTTWYTIYDSDIDGNYSEISTPKVHINYYGDLNEIIFANGDEHKIFKINPNWATASYGDGPSYTAQKIAQFDASFYAVLGDYGGTENLETDYISIGDGFRDMKASNYNDRFLLIGKKRAMKDGNLYHNFTMQSFNGTEFVDMQTTNGVKFKEVGNKIGFKKIGNSNGYIFYVDKSTHYSHAQKDTTSLFQIHGNIVKPMIKNILVNDFNSSSSQDGLGNEGGSKVLKDATFGYFNKTITDVNSGYLGLKGKYFITDVSDGTDVLKTTHLNPTILSLAVTTPSSSSSYTTTNLPVSEALIHDVDVYNVYHSSLNFRIPYVSSEGSKNYDFGVGYYETRQTVFKIGRFINNPRVLHQFGMNRTPSFTVHYSVPENYNTYYLFLNDGLQQSFSKTTLLNDTFVALPNSQDYKNKLYDSGVTHNYKSFSTKSDNDKGLFTNHSSILGQDEEVIKGDFSFGNMYSRGTFRSNATRTKFDSTLLGSINPYVFASNNLTTQTVYSKVGSLDNQSVANIKNNSSMTQYTSGYAYYDNDLGIFLYRSTIYADSTVLSYNPTIYTKNNVRIYRIPDLKNEGFNYTRIGSIDTLNKTAKTGSSLGNTVTGSLGLQKFYDRYVEYNSASCSNHITSVSFIDYNSSQLGWANRSINCNGTRTNGTSYYDADYRALDYYSFYPLQ